MSDKVSGGDPLKLSARVWNGFVDAADAHRNKAQLGVPGGRLRTFAPECSIKIQNDSGADLDAGEVLAIGATLLTAPDKRHLWFSGDAPTSGQVYAVLSEAISYPSIGLAQVAGVCLALVDVGDADHTHAHIDDGETTLMSDFGGTAHILWKPSGTGVKECMLLLGVTSPPRKAIADADITAGSSAAVSVYINGSDVGSVTAWFNWMEAGTAEIASGTEVLIQWFDDESRWVVIAAECQA